MAKVPASQEDLDKARESRFTGILTTESPDRGCFTCVSRDLYRQRMGHHVGSSLPFHNSLMGEVGAHKMTSIGGE